MQNGTDEQTLVRKLSQGDQTAFELLFYRYRGKVYNFVRASLPRHSDSEEVVHEVFLRIWTGRGNLDSGLPFGPYLFRTARNLVIDRLRGRVNRMVSLSDELFPDTADSDAAARDVEERQLGEWFDRTLEQLPEHRRQIFVLSRLEGLSYREIAARLGVTENTVDTQIRRALLFFREELKKLRLLFLF